MFNFSTFFSNKPLTLSFSKSVKEQKNEIDESKNYIKNLPDELILKIFKNLSVQDVYKIGLISKNWLRLTLDKDLKVYARLPTQQLNNIIYIANYIIGNQSPKMEGARYEFEDKTKKFKEYPGILFIDDSEQYLLKLDDKAEVSDFVIEEKADIKSSSKFLDRLHNIVNVFSAKMEGTVEGFEVFQNPTQQLNPTQKRILESAQLIFNEIFNKQKKTK